MFDIGFSELVVCLVVALVVIGPERLPETVRTIALWIGRLKRSLRDTRTEIERQIGADDIRRQLYNEEILRNLEKNRIALEKSIQEMAEELGPEAQARLKQRIYEHEELPDHAHMNETPAVVADSHASTQTSNMPTQSSQAHNTQPETPAALSAPGSNTPSDKVTP